MRVEVTGYLLGIGLDTPHKVRVSLTKGGHQRVQRLLSAEREGGGRRRERKEKERKGGRERDRERETDRDRETERKRNRERQRGGKEGRWRLSLTEVLLVVGCVIEGTLNCELTVVFFFPRRACLSIRNAPPPPSACSSTFM